MDIVGSSIQARVNELIKTRKERIFPLLTFMVDEARAMVKAESFVAFRRTTRLFPRESGHVRMFCIVTDTTSKVSDFSPPQGLEESERARELSLKTFQPLTVIESLDSWWSTAAEKLIPASDFPGVTVQSQIECLRTALIGNPEISSPKGEGSTVRLIDTLTIELLEEMDLMATLGRPVFYSFLFFKLSHVHEDARAGLVHLMQQKLLKLHPRVVQAEPSRLSKPAAVAILGFMASIEVSASSELATELASGHLRLVGGISIDRSLVFTMEISEPVIAMAAHYLIKDKVVTWKSLIDAFFTMELSNSTMVGFRGEVAVQILLLVAWQMVLFPRVIDNPRDLYRFTAVTVFDFLVALI